MKSFSVDLATMLTVGAGLFDAEGVLLGANAGFLRLLPPDMTQPLGERLARVFIQPAFAQLVRLLDQGGEGGYRGLMTIGDYADKTRTLRGHAWRAASGIHVLVEYDIVELERLSDAMLELNRESAVAQQGLARANVVLKQREVRMVEAALTDVLTGVGNRRKLEQALAAEIARARRSGDALSAIMADIDHFKRVNDEFGHGGGDKVLAAFGAMLLAQTRPTDVVARFGGEEFVLLLPHTELAQAAAKAEQIRTALAAQITAPMPRAVTVSFGVAQLADGEDAASFIGRADAALYAAKEGGRNRVMAAP